MKYLIWILVGISILFPVLQGIVTLFIDKNLVIFYYKPFEWLFGLPTWSSDLIASIRELLRFNIIESLYLSPLAIPILCYSLFFLVRLVKSIKLNIDYKLTNFEAISFLIVIGINMIYKIGTVCF